MQDSLTLSRARLTFIVSRILRFMMNQIHPNLPCNVDDWGNNAQKIIAYGETWTQIRIPTEERNRHILGEERNDISKWILERNRVIYTTF